MSDFPADEEDQGAALDQDQGVCALPQPWSVQSLARVLVELHSLQDGTYIGCPPSHRRKRARAARLDDHEVFSEMQRLVREDRRSRAARRSLDRDEGGADA
ncbi:hypothetical protein GKE82_24135 [Conexibacter sp. W3-3-2]|uniref:hypothetical protein n=1 Tax=Conexibacter sp. W3-3-2 TaxID=2675227 RepID=UPI0012BA0CC5|nr:hypothetical protein [Conexibacter sp. W3-3-2]MTD47298.1 hypothetical protein [Conexibacter sp. W3-3-2]